MKSKFLMLLAFACMVTFASAEEFDYMSLLGKTHKDVIELFGAPDYIIPDMQTSTFVNEHESQGVYLKVKKGISFVYKNDADYIHIYMDRKDAVENPYYNPYEEQKDSALISDYYCTYIVTGFDVSCTSETKNLPYGIKSTDCLFDAFKKLGNPDKYYTGSMENGDKTSVAEFFIETDQSVLDNAKKDFWPFIVDKITDRFQVAFTQESIVNFGVWRLYTGYYNNPWNGR